MAGRRVRQGKNTRHRLPGMGVLGFELGREFARFSGPAYVRPACFFALFYACVRVCARVWWLACSRAWLIARMVFWHACS